MRSKRREDAERARYVRELTKYIGSINPDSLKELERVLTGAPFTDRTKNLYRFSTDYADRREKLSEEVQPGQGDQTLEKGYSF